MPHSGRRRGLRGLRRSAGRSGASMRVELHDLVEERLKVAPARRALDHSFTRAHPRGAVRAMPRASDGTRGRLCWVNGRPRPEAIRQRLHQAPREERTRRVAASLSVRQRDQGIAAVGTEHRCVHLVGRRRPTPGSPLWSAAYHDGSAHQGPARSAALRGLSERPCAPGRGGRPGSMQGPGAPERC